ncbi:MAG TPA: hypothetical protein VMT80_00070, partial [Candidatus Paceibacterota bacterium]|nr:hypothetical protein [Candidatus Paceibacterota bacterium]
DEVRFVQPRDMSVFQGSSARALVELGREKGYELVAATSTNLFFIDAAEYPKLGLESNELCDVRVDRSLETKLFQLYDGTLVLAGTTRLVWHKLPIDQEKIQVLPRYKRRYPARIPESDLTRRLKQWARTLPFYPAIQRLRSRLRSLV